ncbi:PD-(D/E)XK nuclease family protein [Brachybacterium sp. JHP9]|uniref:PD-(D/E)XK nuclease family protein n=1 Tax=Brachybacterium equifaecis TaxID=2910770 RepID=A0ABT0QY94_9MICO|nr:PD-(D/E)XK nuclease family protein [Brachybacterium equifaecis]MCL6422640.1 PD-(D/E)XK nuclease family protein [Brachybacterium equifaecis]
MEIEFGWTADGASWVDAGAVTGAARVGPRSLVQLLQNRLGLTRPAISPSVRIAQQLARIQSLLAAEPQDSEPGNFWPAASFAVDPWATASQLLRWRDAAVEAGWRMPDSAQPLPPRLAALRDLELHAADDAPRLAPSLADDLRELIAELAALISAGESWPLGITRIIAAENPASLPGLWPELFALLGRAGVELSLQAEAPASPPQLHVIACQDEWTAADAAARALRAITEGSPEAAPSALTVLATGDTAVLDQALHRRCLPAIGQVASSTARAHHQVLPLFLDVATAPLDVHQLAALLDLRLLPPASGDDDASAGGAPVGLFPAAVRGQLLRALSREPGVGGEAWQSALAVLAEDPRDPVRAAAAEIDRLVREPLQSSALTPPAILERLDWLSRRLRQIARGEGDLLGALTQIATLREVLGLLPARAPIAPRLLAQAVEAAGGSGRSPLAAPEASSRWRSTTKPEHLSPAPTGTVLWWAPSDGPTEPPARWDPLEVQHLEHGGARLLAPQALAQLHVDAALRGLHRAQRIIAVLPGRAAETALPPSGLLALLEAEAGLSEAARLAPEALIDEHLRTWTVGGHALPLAPARADSAEIAPSPAVHQVPPAAHLLPRRLSFSQISGLLACPHHWLLEYPLALRPAASAALPTGISMVGTLVHAVVENLVAAHTEEPGLGMRMEVPSAQEIGTMFDALVPRLAAELALPEREAERSTLREQATHALTELFTRLRDAGLRITGTESRFELPLLLEVAGREHAVQFVGSRDLDAVSEDGQRIVIDLKWSHAQRRYTELYEAGDAIQLASYAWSVAHADAADAQPLPSVAYGLLRSGSFIGGPSALDPRGLAPLDSDRSWNRMIATLQETLAEIAQGRIRCGCVTHLEAAGIAPGTGEAAARRALDKALEAQKASARAQERIALTHYCASSDYAQLCGLMGELR